MIDKKKRKLLFLPFLFNTSFSTSADNKLEKKEVTKIAFGSCAEEENIQPIWKSIDSYNPDFFIFLGDNVYGDVFQNQKINNPDIFIKKLEYSYNLSNKFQILQNSFKKKTTHFAIWDDHDFGGNDSNSSFIYKKKSKDLFLKYWKIKNDDIRNFRDGIYFSKNYTINNKKLQLIFLDTRYFRSVFKKKPNRGNGPYVSDFDVRKTMLGNTQWKWLKNKISENVDVRIISSSIQIISNNHNWEKWGNLPLEKNKLYNLLKESNVKNTFFLSGDRHFGAIYKEKKYNFYEITSSGLNKRYWWNEKEDQNIIGNIFKDNNFGSILIDWKSKNISLSIHNINGTKVRNVIIPLK